MQHEMQHKLSIIVKRLEKILMDSRKILVGEKYLHFKNKLY